jgi:hypothetical protein
VAHSPPKPLYSSPKEKEALAEKKKTKQREGRAKIKIKYGIEVTRTPKGFNT